MDEALLVCGILWSASKMGKKNKCHESNEATE